jgi:arylsulfatase A-like enzyme
METFDPHEPYFVPQKYLDLYPHDYDGPHFDWPPYTRVTEDPAVVRHIRCVNAALISMCDAHLGKVLDLMDELDLWSDTMLIVNTDHGFMLGEHDLWAKCWQPFYNEIAHMPLFIWDPRVGCAGRRRESLVQTIDLAPTLLEYFGADRTADMEGAVLTETLAHDTPVRPAGIYGMHGGHVNVTDGRYVYMRAPAAPDNRPLYNYTLMPTHMRHTFRVKELQDIQLAEPFRFTKGCRTMKIAAGGGGKAHEFGTMLFDLEADPAQDHPRQDAEIERRMIGLMVDQMKANDCPPEQFQRLGLDV